MPAALPVGPQHSPFHRPGHRSPPPARPHQRAALGLDLAAEGHLADQISDDVVKVLASSDTAPRRGQRASCRRRAGRTRDPVLRAGLCRYVGCDTSGRLFGASSEVLFHADARPRRRWLGNGVVTKSVTVGLSRAQASKDGTKLALRPDFRKPGNSS